MLRQNTIFVFLKVRGYPKDNEVLHELKNSPLYENGDKREECKFISSVFEETYGHKEKVDLTQATLEHTIMFINKHKLDYYQELLPTRSQLI